jgi:hypothetical protein
MTRILVSFLLGTTLAYATDQTILGTQLLVKNPSTAEKRKVTGKAKEPASQNTIVGDPTVGGATLVVRAEGTHPTEQTFALPQGTNRKGKPLWSGDTRAGFKYKDPDGANGAVKQAQIKKSAKGVFTIRFTASGKLGTVSVVPPDAGVGGCILLELNGGDSYSVRFAPGDGDVTNKDGTSFKVKKPSSEGTCVTASTTSTSNTTSSTNSSSIPTSSTTSSSIPTSSTTSSSSPASSTTSTSNPTSTTSSSSTTTTTSQPTSTTIFAGPAFPPVGGTVSFNFTGNSQNAGGADLALFNFSPTTWTALYWGSWTAPSNPTAGLDGSPHALPFVGISGSNTIATWQGTSPWTNPGDMTVHVVPIRLTVTLVTPPTGVVWTDSTTITGLDPGAGTGIGAVVNVAPAGTAQDFTVKFEFMADIPTDDPTGFIPFGNVPQTGGGLAVTSFSGAFYSQP